MRIYPQWTFALYGTLEPRMTTPVQGGAIGVETWNKVLGFRTLVGPFSNDNTSPTVLCPMDSFLRALVERQKIHTDGSPQDGLN